MYFENVLQYNLQDELHIRSHDLFIMNENILVSSYMSMIWKTEGWIQDSLSL